MANTNEVENIPFAPPHILGWKAYTMAYIENGEIKTSGLFYAPSKAEAKVKSVRWLADEFFHNSKESDLISVDLYPNQ